MPQPEWIIERLTAKHLRAEFRCGRPALDDWLKLRVSQFEKRDLARTYVAVRRTERIVLGFYALASHRVTYEALPEDQAKGLPRIDVPVVLLARLAVDQSVQGKGLGELLLVDALRRVQHFADSLGIRAIEVDALDDKARSFYTRYGFVRLLDDANHLFLPVHTIRKLGLPPLR